MWACALAQFESCRPHVIVYCCFSSSVVQGVKHDARPQQDLTARSGVRLSTAPEATVDACRALGLRRVSVVSPYGDDIDAAGQRYLTSPGREIVSRANFANAFAFDLVEHTAAAMFLKVPFQGGGPGVTASLSNNVDPTASALHRDSQLRRRRKGEVGGCNWQTGGSRREIRGCEVHPT
jgi:Arylmalonate decarboxylase